MSTRSKGCEIKNASGVITTTGTWIQDGIDSANSTDIADVAAVINTANKHIYKLCYDTSNSRLMIAQGSAAADTWKTAADFGAGDAVVTVTPS